MIILSNNINDNYINNINDILILCSININNQLHGIDNTNNITLMINNI